MLFVIARDNECEELVEEKLVLCRDWFELLAKKSIGSWEDAEDSGENSGIEENRDEEAAEEDEEISEDPETEDDTEYDADTDEEDSDQE